MQSTEQRLMAAIHGNSLALVEDCLGRGGFDVNAPLRVFLGGPVKHDELRVSRLNKRGMGFEPARVERVWTAVLPTFQRTSLRCSTGPTED